MDNQPKKSLGQHWLDDSASLQAMCDAADVQPGGRVLEIGPGTGELTDALVARGAVVTALEFDKDLLSSLRERFADAQVDIVHGDVRTFDFASIKAPYKIVANIPYYLSANLLRILSETPNKPEVAALLVQKEVAERVAASVGKLSQVAVFVRLEYTASVGALVPAYLFTPPPKVDSQVLVLTKRPTSLAAGVDSKRLAQLIKAGFSAKRKKLRSSLAGGLTLPKPEVESLLQGAGVDPNARAQELSLDQWLALARLR